MNNAIKILEEIGQTTSIKEYKNTQQMMDCLGYKVSDFERIRYQESVCLLFPAKDGDEEESDSEEETDTND